jgi:hypothetical protein
MYVTARKTKVGHTDCSAAVSAGTWPKSARPSVRQSVTTCSSKTASRRKKGKCTNKKFCDELITHFLLIRHEAHRKRLVQQFLYCCPCIRCRGNMFTEPLPSDNRGVLYTQTHRTHTQQGDLVWLLLFFQNRESRVNNFCLSETNRRKLRHSDVQTTTLLLKNGAS